MLISFLNFENMVSVIKVYCRLSHNFMMTKMQIYTDTYVQFLKPSFIFLEKKHKSFFNLSVEKIKSSLGIFEHFVVKQISSRLVTDCNYC